MKKSRTIFQTVYSAVILPAIMALIVLCTLVGSMPAEAAWKNADTDTGMVPDALVALPFEGEPEYVIIVETSSQQLYLFTYGETVREVLRMKCSTGKNAGAKIRAGDSKTPQGVYFLKKQFLQKDLAPIYGSRALTTDYPNVLDRVSGKNGHSIWIHGTNKKLKDRDSNGCIAMRNKDVDRLSGYVTLNRTPLIITDKIKYRPATQKDLKKREIEDIIKSLSDATRTGSYHDYLSFFSHRYLPDIAWWSDWLALRGQAEANHLKIDLDLKNIYILKHKQVYTVVFDQFVGVGRKIVFAGKRKLFLGTNSSALKVISEEYQLLPNELLHTAGTSNPLVAIAAPLLISSRSETLISSGPATPISSDPETEIIQLIDRWLAAWSAKDINVYQNCYSKSFIAQDGKDLKAWVVHKKRLNKKYKHINVTRSKMSIKFKSGYATVRFVQTYASSGFNARGKKKIVIRNEDGEWKIYRETSEKK